MVEISQLNEDLLGQILKRVSDPDERKRVSQVCKQWFILERLTRTSLTFLELRFLLQVLPRFPNLVTFQTSEPIFMDADLKFLAQTCPKLETLNLDTTKRKSGFLPMNGLHALSLGGGLPKLSELFLFGRDNVVVDKWLHELPHDKLTCLDLGHCRFVDDKGLVVIGDMCTSLRYLNLAKSKISDFGLRLLANGRCSKTLRTLVLSQCCYITDLGLAHLRNMQFLEVLDLDYCGEEVTDIGVIAAVSSNRSLKKLNLSLLRNVSDQSMVFLAENCPNLQFLDLSGTNVTGAGVRAFSGHRCLESLDLHGSGEFCWCDIEYLVLGCQSLKSVHLSRPPMDSVPESVSRIVTLTDLW
ncbi:PREDICTED: F-box/LRR-repeat protein 4-like [Fragaria vesca subsp. vesca]